MRVSSAGVRTFMRPRASTSATRSGVVMIPSTPDSRARVTSFLSKGTA